MGSLRPDRQAVAHRQLAADSAVLQRRHDDAVYGHRRHAGARRRDAARDPERRPAKLNAYVPQAPAVRPARAARHRPFRPRRDAEAEPRHHGQLHHAKHCGELPWGASFGFSNDVEVALPYDSRANDFTIGTEWTNTRNMLRVAYTGSWFDNLAPTLIWDSPLRLDDAPTIPDGAAWRSGRRTRPRRSARRLHQAGAANAGDRLVLLRLVEQRRGAAALHDQHGAAEVRAAPRDHRGGSARLLDQPEPHLAPVDRLAVQRALAQLHLQQPHAGHVDHGHDQLRHLGVDHANRRSGPLRAQPDEPSTATPPGRS